MYQKCERIEDEELQETKRFAGPKKEWHAISPMMGENPSTNPDNPLPTEGPLPYGARAVSSHLIAVKLTDLEESFNRAPPSNRADPATKVPIALALEEVSAHEHFVATICFPHKTERTVGLALDGATFLAKKRKEQNEPLRQEQVVHVLGENGSLDDFRHEVITPKKLSFVPKKNKNKKKFKLEPTVTGVVNNRRGMVGGAPRCAGEAAIY